MFQRAIVESIAAFAAAFAERPFDHLFEADIQADLHSRLRQALEASPVDLNQVRGHHKLRAHQGSFSRVHAEYPTGVRFDLALIATSLDQASIWDQPIAAAVEIKLWQTDDTGGGINDDLRKLHRRYEESVDRPCLGVVLIAGHPGKDVAVVGALHQRTPPLEPVDAPGEHGVFVCAINSGEAAAGVQWWRSTSPPP